MNWLFQSILSCMSVFSSFRSCNILIDRYDNSCRQWHIKTLDSFTVVLLLVGTSVWTLLSTNKVSFLLKVPLGITLKKKAIFFWNQLLLVPYMMTLKTDLAACCPPHLQRYCEHILSEKSQSVFLLIVCLFQTWETWESSHKWEWCAVVKSAVEQIAKKKNLELLTYLSNTITSEFGFQKYYLLYSPLAGSCWNNQTQLK